MKGNIPDFDCYHVTREGNVYSKYRDRVTWRKMATSVKEVLYGKKAKDSTSIPD